MKKFLMVAVSASGLVLSSGCGVSKFSFADVSVDQTSATSTNTPGSGGTSNSDGSGGGSGTGSGGSGTGGAGASGAGTGGAGGAAGGTTSGTTTGGAGGTTSGAAGSTSGTTTGGTTTGGTTTPTSDCGAGHTKIEAHYKCHAGPAGAKMKLHCVFRSEDDDHGECEKHAVEKEDDDQDVDLHAVAWFIPGTTADIGTPDCAAEEAGSLLARLNNLQLDNSKGCGRFHFRGTISVCVVGDLPAKKKDRKRLLVGALLNQMAAAKGSVTVNNDTARVGGKRVSVDVPGPIVNPAYCIRHPSSDHDRDDDPDNWKNRLGLRDDD